MLFRVIENEIVFAGSKIEPGRTTGTTAGSYVKQPRVKSIFLTSRGTITRDSGTRGRKFRFLDQ